MHDAQYPSVATLESVSRGTSDNLNSTMLFNMRTKNDLHPIDLKTILKCLKHAQDKETIPALSFHWWAEVRMKYGEIT